MQSDFVIPYSQSPSPPLWSLVALDDGYYNVDATWDDSGGGRYDYFNKTDEDYAGSHIRQELSVYLPPCNGSAYRNLEPDPEESALKSIADLGMTEDQVLTDMDSYYMDCYDQILQNGRGNYTFYNVIEGEQLLEEWHRDYQEERYRQAYMEDAMMRLGISSCGMELEAEKLRDGLQGRGRQRPVVVRFGKRGLPCRL